MSINYCYDMIVDNDLLKEKLQKCVDDTYSTLYDKEDATAIALYILASIVGCIFLSAVCTGIRSSM